MVQAVETAAEAALTPAILAHLQRERLLREGHFAYRSGCHSDLLLDRDRLLADPAAASHMGYALAKHFFTAHVDTIAAPSIWGAGLAQWVAYFLDPKAKVVYATPRDGRLTVAENLSGLLRDRRVLLVDNLVISGDTLSHFAATVADLGAEVVGLGTLWNGSDPAVAGADVFGLLNTVYDVWPAARCPRCAAGGPPPEPVAY